MLKFCDQFRDINGSFGFFSSTEVIDKSYSIEWIQEFGAWYKKIHGYTSIIVCVVGSIVNIWNLVILSKKEMRNAANVILTGLALAELLNMLEYIPFVIYMKFLPYRSDGSSNKTYLWAVFVLVHSILSQVCHTAAICLTVVLPIWRLIMAKTIDGKVFCTVQRAMWIVFIAYTLSTFLCIPIYLGLSISEVEYPIPNIPTINSTHIQTKEAKILCQFLYSTILSTSRAKQFIVDINRTDYPYLGLFVFWFYSIIIKILPCVILTIVSALLVRRLYSLKKRKKDIFGAIPLQRNSYASRSSPANRIQRQSHTPSERAFVKEIRALTRSAKVIVAICVLFLVTELPNGLLALLSGILGEPFFKSCYLPLAEFMDILVLVNNSVNFNLSCLMSQSYRKVFFASFICGKLRTTNHE